MITFKSNPSAVAAQENSRWAISNMLALPSSNAEEQGLVVATDGRAAAVVSVPMTGIDRPTVMPPIPTRGETVIQQTPDGWMVKRPRSKAASFYPPADQGGHFPPMPSVCPDISGNYRAVRINVQFLNNLANAITAQGGAADGVLTLFLPENNSTAIAAVGNAGVGVIMPVALDEVVEAEERDAYKLAVAKLAELWRAYEATPTPITTPAETPAAH